MKQVLFVLSFLFLCIGTKVQSLTDKELERIASGALLTGSASLHICHLRITKASSIEMTGNNLRPDECSLTNTI